MRKPTASSRKTFRDAKGAQGRGGEKSVGLLRSVPQNLPGRKRRAGAKAKEKVGLLRSE